MSETLLQNFTFNIKLRKHILFFSFSIAEKETKKLVFITLHSKISILKPKLKELATAQTAFNF